MTADANPVLIECWRGQRVESVHRGACAVVDADGGLDFAVGDVGRPVYPRSAVKALQAVPLVETGAADAFGLDDRELAVACSSHSGEAPHLQAVRSLLAKAGAPEKALACGAHWPLGETAARDLAAGRAAPTAIHNNCSGKHAGMLALARHLGAPLDGYERPDHAVQARIAATVADMTGEEASARTCAVDGCSVPTWPLSLSGLARAMARFGTGRGLSRGRAEASARLLRACTAHPSLVAGAGRFCTLLMAECRDAVFVKGGAEGVYCAALPGLGLGIAVKIDDGARRGSEAVTAAVIGAYIPSLAGALHAAASSQLQNWRGMAIGRIGPSEAFLAALPAMRRR